MDVNEDTIESATIEETVIQDIEDDDTTMVNDAVNKSPNKQEKYKRSPASIMFNSQVQMNIKD